MEEPAPAKTGVECEGFMASIAHNLLKAIRQLGSTTGPPEPSGSGDPRRFQPLMSSGVCGPVALVSPW